MVPPSWTPPTAEQLAEMLPGYEASGQVGTGSLGPIYKARHLDSDRVVAIKLFPVQAPADAAFVQRFKAEAQSLAAIHHPGIAQVIDYGRTSDGHLYLVWEYVEGTDLFHIQQRQGLSIAHVMELLPQLCASVQHAHDHGVLHRNIRPSNIILRSDGKPVLIDFALVSPLLQDASHETHQHLAIGTPDYIAPELLDGAGDCRVDVYSLGVVFYELLVGRIPRGRYEKPSKEIPSLDPRLDDVVDRAMKFDASERYASAHDMQVAIQMRHAPAPAPTSAEARSPDSVATAILEKLPFPERAAPPAPARPVAAPAAAPASAEQPAAPMAAPVATEWEDVHCTLPWWKKKLVWIAAATVVALAAVGGFWYRWLQTPEIALRETTVEFLDGRRLGKETDVIVSTLGGTLDIDGLAGRLPDGLFFKPRTESDGTTHYRLFGEPKDLDHAPVEFALVAQNGSLQSQPARLTVLIRRTPLTWTVADKVELIIAEPVKADTRIATGIESLDLQEWTPPCPGLKVDDAGTSTTGHLLITGTPKITGTFQVSVRATSRGGISGDKTFAVIVSDPAAVPLAMNDSKPVSQPPPATPNAAPEPAKPEPAKPAPAGGTASSGAVAMLPAPPAPNPAPKGTEPAPEKPPVPSPTPAVTTTPSPTPQGTAAATMPPAPVAGTTPAPATPAPVPVATGVAEVRGDNYMTVFSPYGKHSIAVSEQDWVAGKVLDQKAGRTLVLPNKEDPKLPIQDLTPLTYTAVNPYNDKPEVWPKEEWKDGAARKWGPFTYHLPTPLPVFKAELAKFDTERRARNGDPMLISPYNTGTVTLTWREFVKGGEVKDKKGQPMIIPTIKDPELKARSIDRARQSYVNPYTGDRETWSGKSEGFKEGAQVTWQPGFTFTLADFPPEKKAEPPKPEIKPAIVATANPPPAPPTPKPVERPAKPVPPPPAAKPVKQKPPGKDNFSTSRGFIMQWDPYAAIWICKDRQMEPSAEASRMLDSFTQDSIRKNFIPSNYRFVAEPAGNGKLTVKVVPK